METELLALAENLAWFSRRRILAQPIDRLMVAWEQRFAAQGRYVIRHGLPQLKVFYEADTHKREIDAALASAFAAFNYPAADTVYDWTIKLAYAGGGAQAVSDIGGAYITTENAILAYLKKHAAEKLGKDVDKTTRELVRKVLVQSFEDGWTYNRTVKEVRTLYAGFSARAAQGHIRNRAELIAVNELGNAYCAGSLHAARQLENQGMRIEKAWALATNPCALCQGNASQGWIPLDRNFSSGQDGPTAHPACRCSLMTRAAAVV